MSFETGSFIYMYAYNIRIINHTYYPGVLNYNKGDQALNGTLPHWDNDP